MCTSIFLKTLDSHHLLSRTMDFSFPLDPNPTFFPRKYNWSETVSDMNYENKFSFVGAGRQLGTSYFVADGVNEKGLSIAELYLPGDAKYQQSASADKTSFAPHEFIIWVLGNISTVAELRTVVSNIEIVEKEAPLLNFVTPLHWIITDETGESVVIEPTSDTLFIKENPVDVMTNSPVLEWHVTNLRNYLNVQPKQFAPMDIGEFKATPFSQGTGSLGLPGGYTPPERFIRAAMLKEFSEPAKDETDGVNSCFHILSSVRIPKGVVLKDDNTSDYSQYVGVMCNETRSYYFTNYENHRISKVTLTDDLINSDKVITFNVSHEEDFAELN